MLVQATNRLRQASARSRSKHLFDRAKGVFTDGTTRASVERDPFPIYAQRGEGAYLVDVDGNRLLDLNNNFTTLIHGHGFAHVSEAVVDLLRLGTCFANPTEHEIALAELLTARIPAMERVRFVNSGTEAVMFAIKAARAFTARPAIARIEGAYHGAYDWAEAGQGVSPGKDGWDPIPIPTPTYRGTPSSVADEVHLLRFNDVEGLERRLSAASDRIACVLIDPMPSRAGLLHPAPTFIEALSETAHKYGILIVADEVLNLRQGYAGASPRYGLKPDLVTAGKIIGGGFPIGAIGGREEVMRVFGTENAQPLLPQGGNLFGKSGFHGGWPSGHGSDDPGCIRSPRSDGREVARGLESKHCQPRRALLDYRRCLALSHPSEARGTARISRCPFERRRGLDHANDEPLLPGSGHSSTLWSRRLSFDANGPQRYRPYPQCI